VETAAVEAGSEAVRAGGTGVTVLIVEDERSNLSSLERIFQREGYRTLLCEDA
jgi:CheY-like chemotaxis protein